MQFLKLDNMAPALGVGQTWVDVTASRVVGTTYINNTGRPIALNASFPSSSSLQSCALYVNGVACSYDMTVGNSYGDGRQLNGIIPNGATYSITSGYAPTYWFELR